jgi:ribonuclease R
LSEFPIEETFAQKIDTSIEESEIAKRRDMRDTLTFTIDPKMRRILMMHFI